MLEALVVDNRDAPGYESWVATDPESDSPLLVKYYFFTLLNPGDFLKVGCRGLLLCVGGDG